VWDDWGNPNNQKYIVRIIGDNQDAKKLAFEKSYITDPSNGGGLAFIGWIGFLPEGFDDPYYQYVGDYS